MARTKKVKSTGRFGACYGKKVRERAAAVEGKQYKKQTCPFCSKPTVKRLAKGIWHCSNCGKKFASNVYYLDSKS